MGFKNTAWHLLMQGSDCEIFFYSLCQIRQLKSHKFLPCRGRETWQTTRCSLINHRLQFTTCVKSPARKCSPLTTPTDKLSREENKKPNMLVFLPWGCEAYEMRHQLSSIVTNYTRWKSRIKSDLGVKYTQGHVLTTTFVEDRGWSLQMVTSQK